MITLPVKQFALLTILCGIVIGWPQKAEAKGVLFYATNPLHFAYPLTEGSVEAIANPQPGDEILSFDAANILQPVIGFGGAVTDATVINLLQLSELRRTEILRKLFAPGAGSYNLSYVRVPIGASDFGIDTYTYDEMPPGEIDPLILKFDFHRALPTIAILHQIQEIQPQLKILLSPWSPPAWMKRPQKLNGGSLSRRYFSAYALYLWKTIQAYEAAGLPVTAITVQNEPSYASPKYPTAIMSLDDQVEFIRDYLQPLLEKNKSHTDILGLDHNFNGRPKADKLFTKLKGKIGGIAYHCYAGNVEQLLGSPAPLFLSECSGGRWSSVVNTFHFWLHTQVIGAGLAGARASIAWNILLDEKHGPFTGECTKCNGLLELDTRNGEIKENPELRALAHVSSFLLPGAHRISSGLPSVHSGISYLAYLNPTGSIILVIENQRTNVSAVVFRDREGTWQRALIPAKGAGSIVIF
ncbi:MAG: glycoside hydrolase family 30 protein [Bdellovibrionota bacterium]